MIRSKDFFISGPMKKSSFTKAIKDFVETEQSGGIVLICCAIIALIFSNTSLNHSWFNFWEIEFGVARIGLYKSLLHWVNDGLMAIFFLLVGLEIKREIVEGELSSIKKSMLPVFAACGGMIAPAVIYSLINMQDETIKGWAIPMATDIAFALGVLSLLGNRIPFSIKIMLTALAIVDDLGSIVVIGLFYSEDISASFLFAAAGVFGILLLMNKFGVKSVMVYLVTGLFLWYFTLKSGIHASISGVLLAFSIPLGKGETDSAAEKLIHFIHKPVSFFIMPVFALANTGFIIHAKFEEVATSLVSLGVLAGLYLGKPLGIFLASWLAIKMKWTELPAKAGWNHLLGAGFLGGIGFTMSIFISLLAFTDTDIQGFSKIAILAASLLSGVTGFFILSRSSGKTG